MSNNKNRNNNINAYHEFMEYWSNEEDCYRNAIMKVETVTGGGRTKTQTMSYPRTKPQEQIDYENFMSRVKNPIDNTFYPERDDSGTPIPQPNNQPNCKYVVKTIVRLRKSNGKEYLYTQGQLQGFNSLGIPISTSIGEPEAWTRTLFEKDRKYNPKTDNIESISKKPKGSEKIYELPFSKENVEKLYYKHAVGINGNQMRNGRDYKIALVIKEEQSGIAMLIEWSSPEKSLELFSTKPFKYLWNREYIPDPVKRDMRELSMALTDNKPVEVPQLDLPDNKNYKGYTL